MLCDLCEFYSSLPALGDDGRRGESTQNSRALYTTIERVQREFVVAACRVLDIELGPFPEQIGTGWDAQQEFAKAIRAWYSKCPLRLDVGLGNTCENPGYGELTDMCATVIVDATKIVHRTDHRRGCSDDYGPGVASRRLDLNVPEETSRQLATVIAALRIETTRPPGWLRVTIDNMEK